jgi:hypothetical protein
MLAICAKFAALCSLVVLSVRLVPLIEKVNGSDEIAQSKPQLKGAHAEASIPALDAVRGLPEEANEDEGSQVQRSSLALKDIVFEVGDRVLKSSLNSLLQCGG